MKKGKTYAERYNVSTDENGVLDSVICRFLFIYVDGDYKLITYVEANNQDEAERKVDDGWVRVVQLEEDMQVVYNGI